MSLDLCYWTQSRHGIKCELNAVPATCQQQRWLRMLANSWTFRIDLSPLSFLFSWCNFLTCFRQKSEDQDKHFTFKRETKLWGVALCPDFLKQRGSAVYPVQWHRTTKATEEPLYMLCQCRGRRAGAPPSSVTPAAKVCSTQLVSLSLTVTVFWLQTAAHFFQK